MKKRILLVEDDATLARVLKDNLTLDGFEVNLARDGREALSAARTERPDLALLDLNLPGIDGFELCRTWRQTLQIPVIILTARAEKADKLRGLTLGAEDYITKPFDLDELRARIHAVLRRVRPAVTRITLGGVTIDFVAGVASRRERRIELTPHDFLILRYLAERMGTVIPRDALLRDVWGFSASPNQRAVDHAISRLRRKLEEDAHHPRFIHTVHGDGYVLTMGGAAT